MSEYIDKAALVAEIERRIEAHKETLKNCDSNISEMVLKGSMSAYLNLLHFLDTLEVKEVDLEKEIEDFKEKIIKSSKVYRAYREECGIKDPILLDEVEEAYYAAYEQCYKDNVKSHRECYQKLDCGKWHTKTK